LEVTQAQWSSFLFHGYQSLDYVHFVVESLGRLEEARFEAEDLLRIELQASGVDSFRTKACFPGLPKPDSKCSLLKWSGTRLDASCKSTSGD
jgi:hypothetical protein